LYSHYAPGKCKANVGWDGTPAFFNDGDIKVSETFFFQNVGQNGDDGITTEEEQMDILMKKPSSGQYRIDRLNKVFGIVKAPPGVLRNPKRVYAKDRLVIEKQFVNSLSKSGPTTIMLDEPERSLCLPLQKQVLCDLIPVHMKGKQVIIATHSVFALMMPDANIIDMQPGYVQECRDILNGEKWLQDG